MMRIVVVAALIAVAFGLPTGQVRVVRAVEIGGPQVPPANRTCSPDGEKCAGAANFPFVQYRACCNASLVCAVPEETSAGQWGSFCIEQSQVAVTTVPPTATIFSPTSTPEVDSSPEATDEEGEEEEDDGSVCFPADAKVELEDGSVVRMEDLSIGDVVKVGVDEYSSVFMFTHKLSTVMHSFVKLDTASGASIELTGSHYIYANGALVAASQVKVNDEVTLGTGAKDIVVAVGKATKSGLYNPQTVQGDVVVNGVVSSTYTQAVEPTFAHAVLAPFRLLSSFGVHLTALESGGGVVADVAPHGAVAF